MLREPTPGASLISCVLPFVASSSQAFHSLEMAGQAVLRPDPDASLSRFVPDLQLPWHLLRRESLKGLVNQS